MLQKNIEELYNLTSQIDINGDPDKTRTIFAKIESIFMFDELEGFPKE